MKNNTKRAIAAGLLISGLLTVNIASANNGTKLPPAAQQSSASSSSIVEWFASLFY
jgi:hypothetical protein